VVSGERSGVLHDGVLKDAACAELLAIIENARAIPMKNGALRGTPGTSLATIRGSEGSLAVRRGSAEQSNTSILYGDRLILKLFRHQQAGPNPDCEMIKYLAETAHFEPIPPFGGSIEYFPSASEGATVSLAMLQGFVANEGDGWKWTVDEVERFYENVAPIPFPKELRSQLVNPLDLSEQPADAGALDHIGIYSAAAAELGRRTAELHRALASTTNDPAFAPEPLEQADLQTLTENLRQQATSVFDVLKHSMARVPDEIVELAATVLSRRQRILDHFRIAADGSLHAQRIRIHGDFHLGQVLRVKTSFTILDFEGEPARSVAERRTKQSPLKDVAGMLRSFSYAAYSTLLNYTARRPEDLDRLQPWAQLWETLAAAEFLRAYREGSQGAAFLPAARADFAKLLDVYLFDKSLYELLYELNNRPPWVRIPLLGILSLTV
jgi:maltose alpha-D-glucosyltransferase/alpha-amylase